MRASAVREEDLEPARHDAGQGIYLPVARRRLRPEKPLAQQSPEKLLGDLRFDPAAGRDLAAFEGLVPMFRQKSVSCGVSAMSKQSSSGRVSGSGRR